MVVETVWQVACPSRLRPGRRFLVVMHIPPHTPSRLDGVLSAVTSMKVQAPSDNTTLERGNVYVASSDQHLLVTEGRVRLTRGPKECRSRPAVDVLFRSAAVAYGPRAIGIVLSGMLDDGTAGLWAIKEKGGVAMAQNPTGAQHPSMPESAIRHVQVDVVGDPEALARAVQETIMTRHDRVSESALPHGRLAIENLIANEGNALQHGVMGMGKVSQYTCPDCHGVLVQIEEGTIVRFRCHTGHAFSLQTLPAEVGESIDKGLWDTIRAIEERVLLLRQIGELADAAGEHENAKGSKRLAEETERKISNLRDIVMDKRIFGRQA
jgi:two-component system, chemotaxis family, protein-glutamate methylesterase/glutaminase